MCAQPPRFSRRAVGGWLRAPDTPGTGLIIPCIFLWEHGDAGCRDTEMWKEGRKISSDEPGSVIPKVFCNSLGIYLEVVQENSSCRYELTREENTQHGLQFLLFLV